MDNRGVGNPEGFLSFHRVNAEIIRRASARGFTARYVISLPRWEPLEAYALVQRLLDESPELVDTVVGLDFCHVEEGFPPKCARPLFDEVAADNGRRPGRALEIVYHVGESFYDKSLESAVRWCHEAADLGARRLGHCLALGLDPAIAVRRRPRAHEEEPVSERLDQIGYDIAHAGSLRRYGVGVDVPALERERSELRRREADDPVGATLRRGPAGGDREAPEVCPRRGGEVGRGDRDLPDLQPLHRGGAGSGGPPGAAVSRVRGEPRCGRRRPGNLRFPPGLRGRLGAAPLGDGCRRAGGASR